MIWHHVRTVAGHPHALGLHPHPRVDTMGALASPEAAGTGLSMSQAPSERSGPMGTKPRSFRIRNTILPVREHHEFPRVLNQGLHRKERKSLS